MVLTFDSLFGSDCKKFLLAPFVELLPTNCPESQLLSFEGLHLVTRLGALLIVYLL